MLSFRKGLLILYYLRSWSLWLLFFGSTTCSLLGAGRVETYGSLQAMGGMPLVGIHLRDLEGMQGFDLSCHICPLHPLTSLSQFHTRGLFLQYLQEAGRGLYGGVGCGLCRAAEVSPDSMPTLEGIVGYAGRTRGGHRLFIEGGILYPHRPSDGIARVWPTLSIGYRW